MERHNRNLHRKAQKRAPEDQLQDLAAARMPPMQILCHRRKKLATPRQLREIDEVKFACRKINRQERQQQSDAAHHRVQKELNRSAPAKRPSPQANEEERRNQRKLPEEEPVNKIQRAKSAEQSRLKQEYERKVGAPVLATFPRRSDAHQHNHG